MQFLSICLSVLRDHCRLKYFSWYQIRCRLTQLNLQLRMVWFYIFNKVHQAYHQLLLYFSFLSILKLAHPPKKIYWLQLQEFQCFSQVLLHLKKKCLHQNLQMMMKMILLNHSQLIFALLLLFFLKTNRYYTASFFFIFIY